MGPQVAFPVLTLGKDFVQIAAKRRIYCSFNSIQSVLGEIEIEENKVRSVTLLFNWIEGILTSLDRWKQASFHILRYGFPSKPASTSSAKEMYPEYNNSDG